jgi:hypothetical protein
MEYSGDLDPPGTKQTNAVTKSEAVSRLNMLRASNVSGPQQVPYTAQCRGRGISHNKWNKLLRILLQWM